MQIGTDKGAMYAQVKAEEIQREPIRLGDGVSMKVNVERHGEDRSGKFWIEGRIGGIRFVGEQTKPDDRMRIGLRFYPYDPEFDPIQAFGADTIKILRREMKKAWMKTKQPPIIPYFKASKEIHLVVDDERK